MWICVIAISQPVYAIIEADNSKSSNKIIQKKLIDKLEFEDILLKAQEHSYDLIIADFNTLIAKQDVKAIRSEYFPKLGVSIWQEYTKNFKDVGHSSVASIGDNFINPYTRFQSVMGVTLTYNIFDFGVRGGSLKASQEGEGLKSTNNKKNYRKFA